MKLIMENWRKHLNEAIELSYQPLSNEQIFELAGLDETEKGIMRQGLWPSPDAWPPELDGALDKLVNWFAYDISLVGVLECNIYSLNKKPFLKLDGL